MIIYPEMVKASIEWQSGSKLWYNTMWFFHPSGWVEADATALATALLDWAGNYMLPNLSNVTQLNECVVYDMQALDSWVVSEAAAGGSIGELGGPAASLASCMTVTFRTNRRGRSYRGRNYISGFAETQVGTQFFEAAAVAAIEAAYQNIPTDIAGTGGVHVVASGENAGAPRPFGVHQSVTAYDANVRIYSQRNRTRG